MNIKSKSKVFKALTEKIDIALSESNNFDEAAGKLKNLHLNVNGNYIKPLPTDLCTVLARSEFENR